MERLPMRYRIVVWLTGVACFTGLGGWSAVAVTATAPATLTSAALLGAALGAVLGGLLVAAFVRALEWSGESSAPAPSR